MAQPGALSLSHLLLSEALEGGERQPAIRRYNVQEPGARMLQLQ